MEKTNIMILSFLSLFFIFSSGAFAAWQGDIPDNQVFVTYKSSQYNYSLKIPQGWSIVKNKNITEIVYDYDVISVRIKKEQKGLNTKDIKNIAVKNIKKMYNKAKIKIVKKVSIKSLPAIKAVYKSNSKPNAVTGKSLRLENESYFFYKNGKLLELRLWAPVGAVFVVTHSSAVAAYADRTAHILDGRVAYE